MHRGHRTYHAVFCSIRFACALFVLHVWYARILFLNYKRFECHFGRIIQYNNKNKIKENKSIAIFQIAASAYISLDCEQLLLFELEFVACLHRSRGRVCVCVCAHEHSVQSVYAETPCVRVSCVVYVYLPIYFLI